MGTALKSAGLLIQAGLLGLVLGVAPAGAESRVGDEDDTGRSSGNWSRASDGGEETSGKKKKKAAKRSSKKAKVPVPRPKPGSKAAKREAAARKKAAAEAKKNKDSDDKVARGNTQDGATRDADGRAVPLPKAKPKKPVPERKVQAGLVSDDEGTGGAPYRGTMSKDAIKEALVGRTVSSRIDGKQARIKLGTAGKLSWSISGASGAGFWWTEKGRVCDRYDPAGDFPGRGAGCRSFEQRADGYYAGGKKVNFLH